MLATRAFLVVERKTFDLELMDKEVEGLKLGENGREFRSSIIFWKEISW